MTSEEDSTTNRSWKEVDEFEGDLEADEEWEFDCHMDRNGVCGAAGSEECEFECPYNRH